MTYLRRLYSRITSRLHADSYGEPQFSRDQRNIRINIYHGIANIVSLNLAAPFIGIYAIKIGASDFQVGLLSSGPALFSLLSMIPGGKYIDRKSNQKQILSRLIFLHRLFYFLISLTPFFTEDKRAWLLVSAVALMNMPGSVFNVGWQAYISKIIPASKRADAFAARNKLMNLTGSIVVLLAGRIIDAVKPPVGYQVVFAASFVMALVEIWVFNHIDEDKPEPDVSLNRASPEVENSHGDAKAAGNRLGMVNSTLHNLRQIMQNGAFVRFTLASLVFHFAWQTPWPLFTLYQVKQLGANNTWVSLLSLANTAGSLIGYGFWARMLNQHGNLKTLFTSSIWIFIVPAAYAFSKSLTTIAFFNVLTGAIFAGVNLALFNSLLEVTPEESKATFIGYYTTVINASAIVAPMFGVTLYNLLGFFWAFIVCAGMRIAGSFMFFAVNCLERRIAADSGQRVLPARRHHM